MTTAIEATMTRRTHDTTTPRGWHTTSSYDPEWAEKNTQKGQRSPDDLTVPKSAVTAALKGAGLKAGAEMTAEDIRAHFELTEGTISTLAASVLGEPDQVVSAHRRYWLASTVVERLMISGHLGRDGKITNLVTGTKGRRAPENREVWDEKKRRWVTLLTLEQCAARLGVKYGTIRRWPTPSCADMRPQWIEPYIVERGVPLYDEAAVVEFGKLPAGRYGIPRLDENGEIRQFQRAAKNA